MSVFAGFNWQQVTGTESDSAFDSVITDLHDYLRLLYHLYYLNASPCQPKAYSKIVNRMYIIVTFATMQALVAHQFKPGIRIPRVMIGMHAHYRKYERNWLHTPIKLWPP